MLRIDLVTNCENNKRFHLKDQCRRRVDVFEHSNDINQKLTHKLSRLNAQLLEVYMYTYLRKICLTLIP